MARPRQQLVDRRILDHLAGIHRDDAVAGFGHHAEIVADEQQRGAGAIAEVDQQIDDLCLHGHVERGGRLVGDQQRGLAGQAMAIIARCRMPPESWCGYSS